MKIENMGIHGGTNSFEGITGMEQDIIDALKDQAEEVAKTSNVFSKYPPRNWEQCLTPKASAMIGKMQDLINNQL